MNVNNVTQRHTENKSGDLVPTGTTEVAQGRQDTLNINLKTSNQEAFYIIEKHHASISSIYFRYHALDHIIVYYRYVDHVDHASWIVSFIGLFNFFNLLWGSMQLGFRSSQGSKHALWNASEKTRNVFFLPRIHRIFLLRLFHKGDFGDFGPGHANRSNVSRSRPRHIRPSTERIRLDTNPVKRTRVTHVTHVTPVHRLVMRCATWHVCFLSGFPNFNGSSCPTCCPSRHNPRALHQRITGSCARIASTSDWRLKWSYERSWGRDSLLTHCFPFISQVLFFTFFHNFLFQILLRQG